MVKNTLICSENKCFANQDKAFRDEEASIKQIRNTFGAEEECYTNTHIRNDSCVSENRLKNLEGVRELLAYKRQRLLSMDSFESNVSISSKSKRLVTKDGFVDIKYVNIPGLNSRYLKDIFHTLMDLKWRYISLMFTLSFLISWVIFGTVWYIIFYIHDNQTCIDNVDSWVSAFLFSIETQTTIGYGGRAVTPNCPEGVLLLVIQTIIGMFINCAMLGLLFAKLSRPKNRGKTTMFSKRAVITLRDGNLCMMFRYVDLRHRRLLDTNMRAVIIRPKLTEEGEFIPIDMADLKLTIDLQQFEYTMRLFPLFPITVIHVIDENSPFYSMSKVQLDQSEFEVIPILEGTVPTTGNSTQALTSYRPTEILWGHRFKPVFTGIHIGQNINRIDLSTLHDTYKELNTPDCSAEIFEKTRYLDDCSSVSESHGYQSGPSSTLSVNERVLRRFSSNPMDVCIDMPTEIIQEFPVLKETTT
ncbi:G protein-activated inward rectifier potassium channel 4-like [Hydractinia symbiolongicarpus]|uniref:G protein-activated inward rectifier potassium channel 4-like n=1 Tax=Hydractinia symbiolongicarpus TaxID=13093 RepID=UPI00254E9904|nr:G protein-activated inward rectifier potassium channel 4-like [Hydractinia symbiolongicarpus]